MTVPMGWDELAVNSPRGHVLQSTAWGRIRESQGWKPEYVRLGDPLPIALVLWRKTPLGPLGYVPRGPVIDRPEQLAPALHGLAKLALQRGALMLKVDPELSPEVAAPALRQAGFVRGDDVQPVLATLELDLRAPAEELLARFDKDTRWSVRQAEKRGVTIREVGADDEDLRAFFELYDETGRRAHFLTRPWPYYRTVWRTLLDAKLARLWLAEYEGGVAAGAMTWRCGERELYQYGATNDRGRKCFAAYGLQWAAIMAARERGATCYDFGGIPADLGDTSDTMQGPYLFKRGFGGTIVRWVGAHDVTSRPLAYRAYGIAMPLYTRALQAIRG